MAQLKTGKFIAKKAQRTEFKHKMVELGTVLKRLFSPLLRQKVSLCRHIARLFFLHHKNMAF